MKLHEIIGSKFLTDKDDILEWIRNNADMVGEPIHENWMTIHPDGTVDIDSDVNFYDLTVLRNILFLTHY